MRTFLFSLFASLILGACGGGDMQPAPLLIEAYGDSTMYGQTYSNGTLVQVDRPAPTILQDLLRARFGDHITVTNHGVPGETSISLLSGSNGFNRPWLEQMAQSRADVVIFNVGINDSNPSVNETPEQFKSNTLELARIALAYGKIVIIETAHPCGDDLHLRLPDYVARSREAAQELTAPLIEAFSPLQQRPDWLSFMSDPILVHPTQAGYEIKAQIEFDALSALIPFFGRRR